MLGVRKLFDARNILALSLGVIACAAPSSADELPRDFVSLADIAPAIKVDMRYYGSDNFTGKPVPGYLAAKCLLTRKAADSLRSAQDWLNKFQLRLVVYDCYRPTQAVKEFGRWASDLNDTKMKASHYPKVGKETLFRDGYISHKSGHSRGSTVDIGIEGLDMGAPFDFFDPISHTANSSISQQARANRALLSSALERVGFENYAKEWWHFTVMSEQFPSQYFDVPVK